MATNAFHLLLCIFLVTLAFPCHSRPSTPKAENPKFFDFIKNLEGCKKGQTVIGLQQLRTYLRKYGYLNYSANQTHTEDNNFDDALEAAVKTYQINFRLKPTGMIDAQTVSQLMKSRADVPDIINDTNRMQAHKKIANHTQNTLHNDSHFVYLTTAQGALMVWPMNKWDLTYGFRSEVPPFYFAPIRRAFNTWAAVSVFSFSQATYDEADLKIWYVRGAHPGCPQPFGQHVLAHSSGPTDGELHFNADKYFAATPTRGAYDMETVALHEIGHLIGLDHSDDREAIMYTHFEPEEVKGLNDDDLEGIQTLYNF